MIDSTSMHPFQLLSEIANRNNLSVKELPYKESQDSQWRGIGFRLGAQRFVAPMQEVDEILYIQSCTRVPGVKSWVNGITNIRGRLLTIIDLGAYFGRKSSESLRTSRVLAVQMGDFYCGVVVDEVLGMQTFLEGSMKAGNSVDECYLPFVKGSFEQDQESWAIFSLFDLVQTPEFLQVAV